MPYYVYIIQCGNDHLYTGYTKNLNSRLKLHIAGKGARYTKMHKPKRLVYVETFNSRSEALKRERCIKRLNHQQKLELAKAKFKL